MARGGGGGRGGGRREWVRPIWPGQPRQGLGNKGSPDCGAAGPHPPPTALTNGLLPGHQPFAQVVRDSPPNCAMLLLGRSFFPPSRLKSPPMFVQFPEATSRAVQEVVRAESSTRLAVFEVYGDKWAPVCMAQIPLYFQPPRTAPAKPCRF